MTSPSLTIATAAYDDFVGCQMLFQSLLLYHDVHDVELLVVDNHPTTQQKKGRTLESNATAELRKYIEGLGGRYIPLPKPHGTAAPRNAAIQAATADVVLVCDSHIMLGRETIPQIRAYFADPAHDRDIVTGPLLQKRLAADGDRRLAVSATHYADVWRSEMWGIWAQAWSCPCHAWNFDVSAWLPEQGPRFDQAGAIIATPPTPPTPLCQFHALALGRPIHTACPACGRQLPADLPHAGHVQALQALDYLPRGWSEADAEPFEIPGMGLGMFAVRKAHWPGFPPEMQGFGGGELHMHESYRRAGGRAVCLPQATWWHCFTRTACDGKVPYPINLWEKVRNYVLWRNHLGMPLDPVHCHFVTEGKITEAQWAHLLEDPIHNRTYPGNLLNTPAATPAAAKPARPQPPTDLATIDEIYAWLVKQKRDCISHLPAIRNFASRCQTVVALVKRREWDVAILAGQPAAFASHNTEPDPLLALLKSQISDSHYSQDAADSLAAEPIPNDLLLIDTVHSAERLNAELARWLPHCRRWIAIRGTKAFGEKAEKTKAPGLLPAIRALQTANPEWHPVYREDTQYGLTVLSRDPDERTIDRGPGTELHRIFDQLGVKMQEGCACRARISKMDAWGAAGCRKHQAEIVTALEADRDKYSWGTQFKAAFKTLTTGLITRINPLNPIASLVDEAIRRTEADDAAWEAAHP